MIATHEVLTKPYIELLEVEEKSLAELAEKADVDVVNASEHILLIPRDIYNLKSMDLCIKGYDVLINQLREGKKSFMMGDLKPDERDAVREIFLAQGMGEAVGPALFDDKAPIFLGKTYSVSLEHGGKTVNEYIPVREKVDSKSLPPYSDEDVQKFVKEELPKKYKKRHSVHELIFTSNRTFRGSSTKRAIAMAEIAEIIEKKIEAQEESYKKSQAVLNASYGDKMDLQTGQAAKSLGQGIFEQLAENLAFDESGHGFSDRESAKRFLEEAKISRVRSFLSIGIGWFSNVGRTHSVPTTVRRDN